MNVFVFGGRDFNDYNLLNSTLDNLLKDIQESITIIEGDASGADKNAGKYANEKGYGLECYPAKWNDLETQPCKIKYNRYNKPYNALAGFNRNRDMVNELDIEKDIAVGFWDGKSKGTKDSIDLCKKKGVRLEIIKY